MALQRNRGKPVRDASNGRRHSAGLALTDADQDVAAQRKPRIPGNKKASAWLAFFVFPLRSKWWAVQGSNL
ncbi:hypothetical protein [Xanthomonas sp. 60]